MKQNNMRSLASGMALAAHLLLFGCSGGSKAPESAPDTKVEVSADDAKKAKALFEQAVNTGQSGKYGEEQRLLDHALALNPNDAVALARRGSAKYRNGDPKGAVEDCTAAIAIDLELADAYSTRGYCKLANLGDPAGGMKDLDMVIRLKPTSDNYYNRGKAKLYFTKDFAGAVEDLEECIARNPQGDHAYVRELIAQAKAKMNSK